MCMVSFQCLLLLLLLYFCKKKGYSRITDKFMLFRYADKRAKQKLATAFSIACKEKFLFDFDVYIY